MNRQHTQDRQAAIAWAQSLVQEGRWCTLDTETTGLLEDKTAQACQIAVVSSERQALFESLIRPTVPIPARATAIHGITNDRVKDAPTFAQVWPRVVAAISGRKIVIYNARYDTVILVRSAVFAGIRLEPIPNADCLMKAYARFYGVPGPDGYRWQKLTEACRQCNIGMMVAHTALADALASVDLVYAMAHAEQESRQIDDAVQNITRMYQRGQEGDR